MRKTARRAVTRENAVGHAAGENKDETTKEEAGV